MHAPSLARIHWAPGAGLTGVTRRLAIVAIGLLLLAPGCGRKGDPVPRPRVPPGACTVRMLTLRRLSVALPERDLQAAKLRGIERVRVYYLPLGTARPAAAEVVAKGEIVLERSRPELPGPGASLELDLDGLRRPRGWLVVVAVRVGDVVGDPGEVMTWLDPEL